MSKLKRKRGGVQGDAFEPQRLRAVDSGPQSGRIAQIVEADEIHWLRLYEGLN